MEVSTEPLHSGICDVVFTQVELLKGGIHLREGERERERERGEERKGRRRREGIRVGRGEGREEKGRRVREGPKE